MSGVRGISRREEFVFFWSILKIAAPVEIFYGSPNVKNIFIEVDIAEFKSAKFAVAKPGS